MYREYVQALLLWLREMESASAALDDLGAQSAQAHAEGDSQTAYELSEAAGHIQAHFDNAVKAAASNEAWLSKTHQAN